MARLSGVVCRFILLSGVSQGSAVLSSAEALTNVSADTPAPELVHVFSEAWTAASQEVSQSLHSFRDASLSRLGTVGAVVDVLAWTLLWTALAELSLELSPPPTLQSGESLVTACRLAGEAFSVERMKSSHRIASFISFQISEDFPELGRTRSHLTALAEAARVLHGVCAAEAPLEAAASASRQSVLAQTARVYEQLSEIPAPGGWTLEATVFLSLHEALAKIFGAGVADFITHGFAFPGDVRAQVGLIGRGWQLLRDFRDLPHLSVYRAAFLELAGRVANKITGNLLVCLGEVRGALARAAALRKAAPAAARQLAASLQTAGRADLALLKMRALLEVVPALFRYETVRRHLRAVADTLRRCPKGQTAATLQQAQLELSRATGLILVAGINAAEALAHARVLDYTLAALLQLVSLF